MNRICTNKKNTEQKQGEFQDLIAYIFGIQFKIIKLTQTINHILYILTMSAQLSTRCPTPYILLALLTFTILIPSCHCYDYTIPVLQISQKKHTKSSYYINYLQDLKQDNGFKMQNTDLKDGIVHVKLTNQELNVNQMGGNKGAQIREKINNVYYYDVRELENVDKGGSNMANSLCNVVKSLDDSKLLHKFFIMHQLKQTPPTQQQSYLSSTLSSTQHSFTRSPSPSQLGTLFIYTVSQKIRTTLIHSITSQLTIHKINITQNHLSIGKKQIGEMGASGRDDQYQGYDQFVEKTVLQYESKGDGQRVCGGGSGLQGMYEVDGVHVLVCYRSGKVSILKVRLSQTTWSVDAQKILSLQSSSQPQITKSQQSKSLYILVNNEVHHLQTNPSLQLTRLPLPSTITFSPVLLQAGPQSSPTQYLLLCTVNGLQFYNTQAQKIQYTQKFDNLISMNDVEYVSYRSGNDVDVGIGHAGYDSGVLMMVLLAQNRKQFIVEMFYQATKGEGDAKLKHQLHINKIYHSYNANTNQANKFSYSDQLQQQPDNINTILKILHPRTIDPKYISNNIGILQSKHKLLFFQYGIPRTLSPYITANSQYITENTYPNIVDVSPITNKISKQKSKNYTTQWIQQKIGQINNKGFKIIPKYQRFIRYMVTLNNYIYVLQIDPIQLWHYEYVCNLNQMGIINERHTVLNDVQINLEGLCEKNVTVLKAGVNVSEMKLGYCEQTKTVQFFVNYSSLQNQRDQTRHYLFIFLWIFIGSCILAFGIAFYGHLKQQINKLKVIIQKTKQKRVQLSDNSKVEQMSQGTNKQRHIMKEQVTID